MAKPVYVNQTMRLSCLNDFPRHPQGIEELARAIEEASEDSERFARELVDSFVDNGGECPDPRQIRSQAWDLLHPEGRPQVGKSDCPNCQGRGFISFQKLKRWNGEMVRYDYAAPCPCRGPIAKPVDAAPRRRASSRGLTPVSEVRIP